MSQLPRVEALFYAALEKRTADERAVYLNDACRDAPDVRHAVDRLLAAHDLAGDFLENPPSELMPTVDVPEKDPADGANALAGDAVGPYKLLEQIGEGGMGVVYMADQLAPIRRRVALKIIKPGLDTRQVIARFEAERQALALMDHPNIARVLDAGTTDAGRPYFVMELVRGVPITDYCDANNLPVPERLELFALVCQAVQHAHQKGIIHRDIKPSNVLVTMNDGRAVPKVIDFGVAKATNQQLTDKTLFTNFAQMIGTPLYMSPEQAEMTSLDVDTRTDIYSLGVLLYELLTGTTPFDRQLLSEAAYDEVRRIIREQVPPLPSLRISTLGQTRTAVAAHRQADPHRLSQSIQVDLDWIVMKALEKDRTRRYETATGLAADIKRYLQNEPVEAGPPSAVYRLRKFVRRNRAALAVAATLLGVLILGTVVSSWQAIRATQAERRADEQAAEAKSSAQAALNEKRRADEKAAEAETRAQEAIAERERADRETKQAEANLTEATRQRERAEAGHREARQAVDKYYTAVSESKLLNVPGLQPLRKDLLEAAVDYYNRFIEQRQNDPTVRAELAATYARVGHLTGELGSVENGITALGKAIEIYRDLISETPGAVEYRQRLASVMQGVADFQEFLAQLEEASHRDAIAILADIVHESPNNADYQDALAYAHLRIARTQFTAGRTAERRSSLSQAAAIYRTLSREHPDVAAYRDRVLKLTPGSKMPSEQEVPLRSRVDQLEQLLRQNPDALAYRMGLAHALGALSNLQKRTDRLADADASCDRAIEIVEQLAHDNPTVAGYRHMPARLMTDRADLLAMRGRWQDAADAYKGINASDCGKDAQEIVVQNIPLLLLAAGDEEGYATSCAALLARNRDTRNLRHAFFTVLDCVVRIDSVDAPDDVVALAERVVAADPKNPVFRTALGAALFHASRTEEAIGMLTTALAQHALVELAAPDQLDLVRVSRLLGEAILAWAYEKLEDRDALTTQLAKLRALVEKLDETQAQCSEGITPWALSCAVEIAKRNLTTLEKRGGAVN